MHLIVVSPFPPAITGIGQYGYHITRALASSGLFSRVTVLAGSYQNGEKPNHLGSTEIEYCWEPGQLNARQAILSRMNRLNPDLVWLNLGVSIFGKSPLTNLSGLLTPMFAARKFPTVVTLHELVELADLRALNAPGGPFALSGARLLTRIVTQADVVCLTLQHYTNWLAERGVECAHIPIGAYHEPEMLDETDSQELLFFTTLAPYKGLELLIKAFEILRVEYPQLRLNIAGATHARFPSYIRELQSRYQGVDGLRWLGEVAEEQVKELFRGAQIVILPYTASTGSSSVLYQAAAWGRAIVTSDLREMQALAHEHDLQVEFFEDGNITSLIRSIRGLLNSPEKRREQTQHNLNVMQRIQPAETCRHYLEAFNRALEKRQSKKRIPLSEPA
jgi:glycosyltransferase involved in cell wall biosynthesis